MQDEFVKKIYDLAVDSYSNDEIPVGAIVVKNNRETYKFNCPGNMIFNGHHHCNMIGPDYTLTNIGVYIFIEELK